jgi:hypothetical protein
MGMVERISVFVCFAILMAINLLFGAKWALAFMAPFVLYQIWHRITKGEWIE